MVELTHAVAKTVYSGLVDPKQVNEWVVLAGLIGAVRHCGGGSAR